MGRGPVRHRVFVEDARSDGTYLRATWHGDAHQFVVSTWRDDICTGAVRVPAAEAPALISLLADGLADAATARVADEVSAAPMPGPLRRLIAWLRDRVPGPRRPAAVSSATIASGPVASGPVAWGRAARRSA